MYIRYDILLYTRAAAAVCTYEVCTEYAAKKFNAKKYKITTGRERRVERGREMQRDNG